MESLLCDVKKDPSTFENDLSFKVFPSSYGSNGGREEVNIVVSIFWRLPLQRGMKTGGRCSLFICHLKRERAVEYVALVNQQALINGHIIKGWSS